MHVRGVLLLAASALLAAASLGGACTIDPECDDGNVCNGAETCASGACQPGTAVPNGASCSDQNVCNGAETCQGGACYPGYPQICGNYPGTVAWCDPLVGCRYQLRTGFDRCDIPSTAALAFALAKDACSCNESPTHGQYVRCIAQAAAVQSLPRNCKGLVKRCAARSTCGKPTGFVTCCFARPGVCDGGRCQDGDTPCSGDEDCPPRNRCTVKSSAAACVARGGSPSGGSCCDVVCGLP